MDYTDQYARIMQKMLADNAAAAEAVVAGARAEREAAAGEWQAARNQWQENEQNAAQILQDYTDKYRAQFEKYLREAITEKIAEHMLKKGKSVEFVMALLSLPARLMQTTVNTKLPLAERDLILEFMGMQTVADQAPGHRYRISHNSIVLY